MGTIAIAMALAALTLLWGMAAGISEPAVNITFLPPLENGEQYNVTTGSTLPIKFDVRNISTNEFILDDSTNINITDSNGTLLTNFNMTSGLSCSPSAQVCRANFNALNYPAFIREEVYSIQVTTENANGLTGLAISSFLILPETRYINGTVMNSISNIGISGVTVSTNTGNSTVTNDTGFYSLALTAGLYELKAELEPTHYVNDSISVSTIERTITIQDIELMAKPTGSISGTVIIN